VETEVVRASKNQVRAVISLLGHLFLRAFTTAKILKVVVSSILFRTDRPHEVHVDAVCAMLRSTGSTLDNSQIGSKLLDDFLLRLKELRAKWLEGFDAYGEQVANAIDGLIDARSNKWIVKQRSRLKDVLKRDPALPPTIAADNRPRVLSREQITSPSGGTPNVGAAADLGWPSNASMSGLESNVPDLDGDGRDFLLISPTGADAPELGDKTSPTSRSERVNSGKDEEAVKPEVKAPAKKGLRPGGLRPGARGK